MNIDEILIVMESVSSDYKVKLVFIIDGETEYYTSNFQTDSWRGSYDLPATLLHTDDTIVKQIANLKATDGKAVQGYKGGNFTLHTYDTLFFVREWSGTNSCTAIDSFEIDSENKQILFFLKSDMY